MESNQDIKQPSETTETQSTESIANVAPLAARPPVVELQKAAPAPEATGPRRTTLSDGDDVIPEDAELFELSKRALNARLERHSKKELKQRFGTDDPEEIKAKLDKLAEYEEKEDQRRREEMSERERLQEDLEREREMRLKAEERVETQAARQAGDKVEKLALKYIDDDMSEVALEHLKKHVKNNPKEWDLDDEKGSYKKIDLFFKELAETKPKFSRAYGQPTAPEPQRLGITNTTQMNKPNTQLNALGTAQSGGKKSVRDMSREEYSAWKKANNINF